MTLVVDASVAVKWYIRETGTDEAEALAQGDEALVAPDLVLAEVAGALWKQARRGAPPGPLHAALGQLPGQFSRLVPLLGLHADALDLALRRDHPVYDCFYVALARREGAPLVTADARLRDRFGDDCDVRLLPAA